MVEEYVGVIYSVPSVLQYTCCIPAHLQRTQPRRRDGERERERECACGCMCVCACVCVCARTRAKVVELLECLEPK